MPMTHAIDAARQALGMALILGGPLLAAALLVGLFMLPPALVSTPVKLILFVLADGWMLVATILLTSFGSGRM